MSTTAGPREDLRVRFASLLERIAARTLEQEHARALPYEEVRALADAGFGALRLPVEEGGAGASISEFFALLVQLGAADSNQPQIWRNHIAFVEDRLRPDAEVDEQNRHWREVLAGGAMFGAAWSERNTKFREMATRVSAADGDRHLLNGEKYYSTGSIFADWISVYAKRAKPAPEEGAPEDDDLIVLVPADAPGVETVDDWTGFGQRNTGSGTTRLKDVETTPLGTYLFSQRAPYQEAIYQLVHVATLAGIARAASRDAVRVLQQRTRAYPHGLDEVPAKDAQLQAIIGRVAALAGAAEASVQRAAARLDVAADTSHSPVASEEEIEAAVNAAAIAVYEAQLTVCDDVLAATTLLFDALGSSAVDESRRLDRHWRNARTVTSHNPRVYKERIVGDWYLNGTPPRIFGGGETPVADSAAGERSAAGDADSGSANQDGGHR